MRPASLIRAACALAALSLPRSARAEEDPSDAEDRRGAMTGDWNGARSWLEDRGVTVAGSYASEAFAGREVEAQLAGVAALALDVDRGTRVHAVGFAIHGDGVTSELADVHGVSNNVAEPEVRLFEAYVEQPLGPAAIRAGMLSLDQEMVLAEHGTALVGATFGMIGQISANLVGPVYPTASLGASARLETRGIVARAAAYEGDLTNTHGIPNGVGEHVLGIAELGYRGVKLGAWTHTARSDGAYVVAERWLAAGVGGFVRAGVSPGGPVAYYADAGARISPIGRRPDDVLGIGLAVSAVTEPVGDHQESIVELTYQLAITGWLTLQPDAQLVVQPARVTPVVGLRATVQL